MKLIIIILLICNSLFGQSIEGKYSAQISTFSGISNTLFLELLNNGNFIKKDIVDTKLSNIYKGKWIKKGKNKIELIYNNGSKNDCLYYKQTKKGFILFYNKKISFSFRVLLRGKLWITNYYPPYTKTE